MDTHAHLARPAQGFAALERDASLTPFPFSRRTLRPHDVAMDVLFCGICHTDLHFIGPWGQEFPLVPGHEIIGRVTETGSEASKFNPGDLVAVSVMVDSCRDCGPCHAQDEIYCEHGPTSTYDSIDRVDGVRLRGGFADTFLADERFVYRLPDGLDPAGAAPLLCAGVTSFSPLRHWNVGPGQTVGIAGIGGLGHLGVKFARALGAHVIAFTSSTAKAVDALKLGAHEAVMSSDPAAMAAVQNRCDFILDTIPATHDVDPFLAALRYNGVLCVVGVPDQVTPSPYVLSAGRRSIAGSGAGGTRETQAMLDFCAEHGITAEVEIVGKSEINVALDRLRRNDVRFRFVLDLNRN